MAFGWRRRRNLLELGLILLRLACGSALQDGSEDHDQLTTAVLNKDCAALPQDFVWGVATASYQAVHAVHACQIEGAVYEGGRSPSIWDTFSHTPGKVANNDNGDVACDHYHRYTEDITTMASLEVKAYRFSLSWSRVLPGAVSGSPVHPIGAQFYSDLIDGLLAVNITPVVTLYHWDLPQALEDPQDLAAGWMSGSIVQHYTYYAETMFKLYGDRVMHWITFNEPWVFCTLGYSWGTHAPGKVGLNPYQCGHHVLQSHAAAVKAYRRLQQGGSIGITLSAKWSEPWTYFPWDVAAAERSREFEVAWFSDPVLLGRYPDSMVTRLGDKLPVIDAAMAADLQGSADFLGINHYTTNYVSVGLPSPGNEAAVRQHTTDVWGHPIGPRAESAWLFSVPWGFRKLLTWLQRRYSQDLVMWVTENGFSVRHESDLSLEDALEDRERVAYYKQYIREMCKAVTHAKVNVRAYFAWSLMDNFEWADGYGPRFGIQYTDFARNETRYLKHSATWLANFFAQLPRQAAAPQKSDEAPELEDLTSVTF